MRSIGSIVYAEDQVILQSVKHESLIMGASDPFSASNQDDDEAEELPAEQVREGVVEFAPCSASRVLRMEIPSILRSETSGEVNGSLELRCFTLKLYGRNLKNVLQTSIHKFR